MNIVTTLKQKTGYIVASAALVLGVIAPGLVSVYVSAAQLTTRSIELSSSSIAATGVTYKVAFTAPSAAGAFAIDFCSNSADTAAACAPAAGFSAANATTATTDYTAAPDATDTDNKRVIVESAIAANENVVVDITGITNPTTSGPLYARIATFVDGDAAAAKTPVIDNGSVVIGITNTIGVSGAVLETMTFCVSKNPIDPNCADVSDPENLPTLRIGQTNGSVVALDPGFISTGVLHTQITTNAATGAVVNLKSFNDCGGLKRADVTTCDIVPAGVTDLAAGVASFGVKTSDATGGSGILRAATGSVYGNDAYAFNFNADKSEGVTSPFGDLFLDTDGKPVNNRNMQLTFGASVANNTPAGNYSTSLSMIATGKF